MTTLAQLARLTAQPSRSSILAAPGGGPPPPTGRDLAFDMQEQSQENWCWAATSTSVSHFYWPASDWTQCKVACSTLSRTDCCNSVVPKECNQPWYLDEALTQTQNFVDMVGPVTFEQVSAEIDAGRVLGARTAWTGGGAHFMAIYGYSVVAGERWLSIDDPIYAKSRVRFADFQTNYEGSGSWTHTYHTKSYTPNMPFQTLRLPDHVARHLQQTLPLLDPQAAPAAMPTSPPPAAAATGTASRSLGLAHPVYTMRLDALAAGRPEPTRAGVRVFEMEADQPRAMFDLDSEHEPQVRQMSTTAPYLRHFSRAMSAALERVPAEQQAKHEARLLRIPALNFDALWIHDLHGEDDEIVPLRSFHGFTAHEPVPYKEAIGRLQEAAATATKVEDTKGA